jgi:hypothetical protein
VVLPLNEWMKDTLPVQRFPPGTMVRETKVRLDGSELSFECELLALDSHLAVVLFRVKGGSSFNTPVKFPPGSLSYGYFWPRRSYNAYRILGPDGTLIAHRFDAVTDVSISRKEVRYRDLVLDWWVLPGQPLLEEDREDYDAAVANGVVPPPWRARAELASRRLRSGHREVIREIASIERDLL